MSRRAAFATPHLLPDAERRPFYRGPDQREGVTSVPCPACGSDVHINTERFIARADRWHDALPEPLQEAVSALFGLRREHRDELRPGRLPWGRRPSIGPQACFACKALQLACIDVHESQPGLYAATLHGLARAADGRDEAATPPLPIDGLRLVLPLSDGDLLLDFILDGPRRLDADAIAQLAPGVFHGEPGMTRLDGIRGADGTWIDADTLRARSSRPAGIDPNAFMLSLSRVDLAPDEDNPIAGALAAHWRPLKRGLALRLEETSGSGFFLHRRQGDFDLDRAIDTPSLRLYAADLGAGWALKAMVEGSDTIERLHCLAAALVARRQHGERAVSLPWPPAAPAEPPASAAVGWWNDDDGQSTQFISDAVDETSLADALSTVVARMRARRDADGAGGEIRLSVTGMAKERRIELCWVDPSAKASIGTRRYALEPRRFAASASADDIEYAARRWATAIAVNPDFGELRVFHRFLFTGRWTPLGPS